MNLDDGNTGQDEEKAPLHGDIFLITRTGMDVKLKCEKCGREIMLPRAAAERAVKKFLSKTRSNYV